MGTDGWTQECLQCWQRQQLPLSKWAEAPAHSTFTDTEDPGDSFDPIASYHEVMKGPPPQDSIYSHFGGMLQYLSSKDPMIWALLYSFHYIGHNRRPHQLTNPPKVNKQ